MLIIISAYLTICSYSGGRSDSASSVWEDLAMADFLLFSRFPFPWDQLHFQWSALNFSDEVGACWAGISFSFFVLYNYFVISL